MSGTDTREKRQKLKKMNVWPEFLLVLLCYGLALAAWLLWQMGGFITNRAAYASGALAPAELGVADFELEGLVERDGVLITTTGDPQLLLKDAARRVENVELVLAYARAPQMTTVYWAPPGQAYSVRRVAYGLWGSGQFLLPSAGGLALRIDPDTQPGNVITVKRIAINQKRPFYAFFIPTAQQAVLAGVLPGLLAAAIATLREAGQWFFNRKAGKAA